MRTVQSAARTGVEGTPYTDQAPSHKAQLVLVFEACCHLAVVTHEYLLSVGSYSMHSRARFGTPLYRHSPHVRVHFV